MLLCLSVFLLLIADLGVEEVHQILVLALSLWKIYSYVSGFLKLALLHIGVDEQLIGG